MQAFQTTLQVMNLYLKGKAREQPPLERFRRAAKVIILANRWKIPTVWREEEGLKEEKVM